MRQSFILTHPFSENTIFFNWRIRNFFRLFSIFRSFSGLPLIPLNIRTASPEQEKKYSSQQYSDQDRQKNRFVPGSTALSRSPASLSLIPDFFFPASLCSALLFPVSVSPAFLCSIHLFSLSDLLYRLSFVPFSFFSLRCAFVSRAFCAALQGFQDALPQTSQTGPDAVHG